MKKFKDIKVGDKLYTVPYSDLIFISDVRVEEVKRITDIKIGKLFVFDVGGVTVKTEEMDSTFAKAYLTNKVFCNVEDVRSILETSKREVEMHYNNLIKKIEEWNY